MRWEHTDSMRRHVVPVRSSYVIYASCAKKNPENNHLGQYEHKPQSRLSSRGATMNLCAELTFIKNINSLSRRPCGPRCRSQAD